MKMMQLNIARYNPDTDDTPWFTPYFVPYNNQTSLLDALVYIKDTLAPDLAFRSSCRMAICGSCGVMVDETPHLACSTFLRNYHDSMNIEALSNFPVERDLVVDLTHFFECIAALKPYIISNNLLCDNAPNLQTPEEVAKYVQFSGCINCALCYAACPQFALNPAFLGPAAITLAHRYNLDTRDAGSQDRQTLLNGTQGVWNCTFVGLCSDVCPKRVDPAAAVQQCKVESALDFARAVINCSKKKAT